LLSDCFLVAFWLLFWLLSGYFSDCSLVAFLVACWLSSGCFLVAFRYWLVYGWFPIPVGTRLVSNTGWFPILVGFRFISLLTG